jgi:hypothetical protein
MGALIPIVLCHCFAPALFCDPPDYGIPKPVRLAFLYDGYRDGYRVFRHLPAPDNF